ncbi:MAG: response regulator [Planctomycetota bacterium]|jgi:DNA-binding NtrC family response regulator|nr:response regulator [Planctomycetota bacterium]
MKTENIVLHVDDDQAILDIVRMTLQKRGYKVISISDPTTALKALAECAARVVILDIDMPGKDGLTLLKEIKQRDAGIQAIMLTGMVSMGTILHATGLGAQECVFKPVKQLREVGDAVDRCFANIERWWSALREWMERRNEMPAPLATETSGSESGGIEQVAVRL